MAALTRPYHSLDQWILHGAIGGLIAGIVFAVFEMVAAAAMGMSFWAPVQMIGAIGLGADALAPTYPLETAVIAGLVIHLVLSAIYGAIFGLVVGAIPTLSESTGRLVLVGAIFGLGLWLVNFYLIAPLAFPWFTTANPIVQFIAHVFFFGVPLGFYLGQALARSAVWPTGAEVEEHRRAA